jgi:DUF1016 N-terminal domain
LIDAARQRAYQAVNTALIELYWQIGEHISRKIAAAEWGDGVVDRLAAHIARTQSALRGFARPDLFRMRQFYEAHVRQIPWTHHLIVLGQSKSGEEMSGREDCTADFFYTDMRLSKSWPLEPGRPFIG